MLIQGGMSFNNGMLILSGGNAPPPSPNLMMEFNAQASWGNQISLYLYPSYLSGYVGVDVTVDWGDGNTQYVSTGSSLNYTYSSSGTYNIEISGNALGYFGAEADGVIGISSWGNLQIEDLSYSMFGCPDLVYMPNYLPNSTVTTERMFDSCYSFNDSNISSWDTSNITDMGGMFRFANSFNQNIGNWDVSNVTNMTSMFYGATAFNQDISNWSVGSVDYMDNMFNSATAFNQDLTNWCTVNVPLLPVNFATSSALDSNNYPVWGTCPSNPAPITAPLQFEIDSSLGSIGFAFSGNVNVLIEWGDGNTQQLIGNNPSSLIYSYGTSALFTANVIGQANGFTISNPAPVTKVLDWGDLIGFDTLASAFQSTTLSNVPNYLHPNVTDLSATFLLGTTTDSNIGLWNTSNVSNMSSTFALSSFNQDIGNWNTSNVTDMSGMFGSASNFNQYIGNWNTQNVANLEGTFYNAFVFDQDIGNWDTSNVTNMAQTFLFANTFNQNIGGWNTSKVTTMSRMFESANAFNQNISSWNTGNVANMANLFFQANAFNQPIGSWNTSNVTDMSVMFRYNPTFNQPIGSWNTSNVTNMGAMFMGATAFNQNISSWNIGNVTATDYMFYYATAFNQDIGNWSTGNITYMDEMFNGATTFNQDLSNWCVTNILSEPSQFDTNTPAWVKTGRQPIWGTCPP